jgi:hypothetical protein
MNETTKRVFRSFALPLPTFEYLKKYQRKYQETHKVLINNNQVIALILADHEAQAVSEVKHG